MVSGMLDFRELWKDPFYRKTIIFFIIVKIVIFSVGVLGQVYIQEDITHRQHRSDNILLNPWAQHDAGAYLDIAKNGYNPDFNEGTGNYSWYPLYPLLIKIFGFIGYDLAAFLIANIASFFAVTVLYIFVKEKVNEKASYKTVFYLLLFPTAYFFTAMYTESLFLLFSLLCFWYAKKDDWLKAGIFGFLSALTRAQGIILFFPIIYMYMRSCEFKLNKINHKIFFVFLIPLGLAVFLLYHQIATGNALIQFQTQHQFGRSFNLFFFEPVINAAASAISGATTSKIYFSFSFLVWVVYLALAYYAWKKLGKEFGIYMFLSLLMPLFTSNFFGITRFALVLFPGFIVLGEASEKNRKTRLLLLFLYVIFAAMLLLFTIRHVNEDIYLQPESLLRMIF